MLYFTARGRYILPAMKTNESMIQDSSQVLTVKQPLSALWPVLLGPLAMVAVYTAWQLDRPGFYAKSPHERLAMPILSVPLLVFSIGAIVRQCSYLGLMAALSIAFFCREWNFKGTSRGVYVALIIIGILAIRYRHDIADRLKNPRLKIWMIATMASYALSQIIARRVFRHILPSEAIMHVPLEEVVETTSHLMLLITSLIAISGKARAEKTGQKTENRI
jgi:hypothetical protein